MVAVRDGLEGRGQGDRVRFIAIQTVFEGHDTNDEAAAIESLKRHGLTDIALGHDSGEPPIQMSNYRTGGTPWTVLIGPDRTVRLDGFQADADQLVALIEAPSDAGDAPTTHGTPAAGPVLTLDDQFPRAIPELALEWQADTAPNPMLVVFNEKLAEELGLDPSVLEAPAGVATLVGNLPPAGSTPVAMAYAGHQFGNYSPAWETAGPCCWAS